MSKVTFLGVEGSGKTVLTLALVNAFKSLGENGYLLRPDSRESYRFLMQQASRFEKGALPGQTAKLKRMAWTILLDGLPVRQLDVLDYPGEIYRLAFLDADDDPDPVGFQEKVEAHKDEIHSFLENLVDSSHVFVLFNLSDALNQEADGRNLDAVWVTNECLDYLHRLPSRPGITFLLTQADRYAKPGVPQEDPRRVFSRSLPLIRNNFPDLDVQAVAAIQRDMTKNGMASIVRALIPEETREAQISAFEATVDCLGQTMLSGSAPSAAQANRLRADLQAVLLQREKLPWFVDWKRLRLPSRLALLEDAGALVKVLEGVPSSDGDALRYLQDAFSKQEFKTHEGRAGLKQRIDSLWKRLNEKSEKRRAERERAAKRAREDAFFRRLLPVQCILLGLLVLVFAIRIIIVWVGI